LRHIQNESGAKALLRGRGSGYIEVGVRDEQLEPLHLLLTAEREKQIDIAKKLCEDLLATVKSEAEASRVPLPVVSAQGYSPYQHTMQPGAYGVMPVYPQDSMTGYYYNAVASQVPPTAYPIHPPVDMPHGMYSHTSQPSDSPVESSPNTWPKANADAKQ